MWTLISRKSYMNPAFPQSSIQQDHDGWIVYSHGNYIGPFLSFELAQTEGERWISRWLKHQRAAVIAGG